MILLSNLRTRFERFCFKNRDKGIPNLMLYVALGNALVTIMSMVNGGDVVFNALCFDKDRILQGQVWRLVSYVFTQSSGGFLGLIFLYFFYMLGRQVENSMGTLKFNLYYFSGVILMDIFAMIFCPSIPSEGMLSLEDYEFLTAVLPVYSGMAYYLHLSLILLFATTHPDSEFLILFIIPVKAWIMAVIYLVLEVVAIYNLSYPVMYFPHNLFPLVSLANYLLFAGKDILNLIPLSLRAKFRRSHKGGKKQPKVVVFPGGKKEKSGGDYNHRCEICGRTDVSNPELEFRYCSRCTGYRCYCQDHINNHTHE
jgi:membrane associated rhomboid family serine protease